MCARLLACPLCSQPGFLTLDALRAGLVSVATRPLVCPVCNEVLLGIDKLTIHLFGHTINLSNNTAESPKHLDSVANNQTAVYNISDNNLQHWNLPRASSATRIHDESCANSSCTTQCNRGPYGAILNTENNNNTANSQSCAQDQNATIKNQIVYISHPINEETKKNISQMSNEISELMKLKGNSSDTLKRACNANYYPNDNIKCLSQNNVQLGQGDNFQQVWTHKQSNQYSATKNINSCDEHSEIQQTRDKIAESNNNYHSNKENSSITPSNKGNEIVSQSFINAGKNSETLVEQFNNIKNLNCPKDNTKQIETKTITTNKDKKETQNTEKILPNLKTFRALTAREKTERCNICGFHFPDYNILILHKQLVHMIEEKDLNVTPENLFKNYSCHLCSKVFKMRGSLMVHMRVAHTGYNLGSLSKTSQVDSNENECNENGYNCPTCGKKFKKEQHVVQHLKTHEGKQWECDVCSKLFTTKYFLKKHKRLHSGEMPYKCDICNKTFTFQQSYHKHRLYHKDDKPHTCVTCGRSFKELSTLHNHERIHTGEKPFACETCGKCFRQRVSYLVHRRIHTGVMPYKCTMCGKSFRYKVSQRTHKCPNQLLENAQQPNDSVQKSINMNIQNTDELYEMQKSQQNQSIVNMINNDENKYILIINNQGQHVLTKESDIRNASSQNKEQETNTETSKELKDLNINIWSSNIPQSNESEDSVKLSHEKDNGQKEQCTNDANDFFSMVMSPLENGLSSPTTEMEHLRVSSPKQKENSIEPFNAITGTSETVHINLVNSNVSQSFDNNNITSTLETINEESLKQLLYGINEK